MVRIYTHGVRAHADEMWACGVLIAAHPDIQFDEIIRDAKRVSEATDEDFVVDCGGKHDGKRLFDHHQFGGGYDVPCALTLVCRAFAPHLLDDKEFKVCFERIRVQDTQGLPTAEKVFGKSDPYVEGERVLIQEFEENPLLVAGIIARRVLRKKAEIDESERAKEWLSARYRVEIVNDLTVVAVEENPFKAGFSVDAFNLALNAVADAEVADITYSWIPDDPAGTGRTLFRTKVGTAKGVNFGKAKPSSLVFCHGSGFLLTFQPENEQEYRRLIKDSI